MSQYNILMNRWNGSSYDGLYPKNTLFGNNPPTTSTAGMKGQFYITPPSQMYVCINNENGIYEWKLTNGNKPRIVVNTDGDTVVVKSQDESISYTKAVSGGQAIFPLEDLGITWTVTASDTAGKSKSTTVLVDEIKDYSIDLSLVDPILNNNTWAKIRTVSDKGTGEDYWSVGDAKAVEINGIVGNTGISGTFYVVLIGFNHNPTYEGTNRIYFQMGRRDLTYNTTNSFCFTDQQYSSNPGSSVKPGAFTYQNNEYISHWEFSHLRKDILGNDNLSATNTFYYLLPEELKQVLKLHNTYSRGGDPQNSDWYSSSDYLWCPGANEMNTTNVQNFIEQSFEYYLKGNTRLRVGYPIRSNNFCTYWTRDLWQGKKYYGFHSAYVINYNNNVDNSYIYYSYGVTFIFCV